MERIAPSQRIGEQVARLVQDGRAGDIELREVARVEIRELMRRWQAGESQRQIAQHVGVARNTVSNYLETAATLGLSATSPPTSEDQLAMLLQLGHTTPSSTLGNPTEQMLSAYRERIDAWLHREHLTLTRISELLAQHGCVVPYTSLRRFVAREGWGKLPKSTVRLVDTLPGDYAEMDFGLLGLFVDPETQRKRAIWALVVVLVYSYHLTPFSATKIPDFDDFASVFGSK